MPGFLLQHAIQGSCPPIEAVRRPCARSHNEIDAERTAIKALRGDFTAAYPTRQHQEAAEQALKAAGRR